MFTYEQYLTTPDTIIRTWIRINPCNSKNEFLKKNHKSNLKLNQIKLQ